MQSCIIPSQIQALLARLTDAGYDAAVVGGCVRDALRGETPHDWDVCTSAAPAQTAACFADCCVVPTGMAHGTVTVLWRDAPIEITTFRADGAYSDHRRPDEVAFTTDIEKDLARRDFTVNAMACRANGALLDPFGGEADLRAGVLRCVGDADTRFNEDALRILRAVRFIATLGLTPAPDTLRAAKQNAPSLRYVSPERIYTELTRMLCGAYAGTALRCCAEILAVPLPFITPCIGFAQHSPYHDKDVWEHIVAATEAAEPDAVVRWALLLHDAAKPQCFQMDAHGIGHFNGHGARSAELARETLLRLRADKATLESVERLVRWHDIPLESTPRCAARMLRRFGERDVWRLLEVKRCDTLAHAPKMTKGRREEAQRFAEYFKAALEQHRCLSLRDLAVSGNDLIALGIPQGPRVGAALHKLLAAVLDGKAPNTREALLALCKRQERGEKNGHHIKEA